MPCFPTLDFSPFLVLLFLRRHPGAGFMHGGRACIRSCVFSCLVCVVFVFWKFFVLFSFFASFFLGFSMVFLGFSLLFLVFF